MDPLISVIIPFYSNFVWLSEAVDSVLCQTFKNYEIIIVNDGCLESDTYFLNKYGNNIIYHRQLNSGPAKARNAGIEIANGDYIAFLDSDDLWLPEKLELQLNYMESNSLAWSHTGYTLFDDSNKNELSSIDVSNFHGNVFSRSLISSPIATPCVMVKSDAIKNFPSFRFCEYMRYGQDGYMWLILSTKYKIGVLNTPLTKVRMRGSNAALKARVYLQVKSQIWEALFNEENFINKRNEISFLTKASYFLSFSNFKIIQLLEQKKYLSPAIIEVLSKIFYLPSYILIKIQKFIIINHVQK